MSHNQHYCSEKLKFASAGEPYRPYHPSHRGLTDATRSRPHVQASQYYDQSFPVGHNPQVLQPGPIRAISFQPNFHLKSIRESLSYPQRIPSPDYMSPEPRHLDSNNFGNRPVTQAHHPGYFQSQNHGSQFHVPDYFHTYPRDYLGISSNHIPGPPQSFTNPAVIPPLLPFYQPPYSPHPHQADFKPINDINNLQSHFHTFEVAQPEDYGSAQEAKIFQTLRINDIESAACENILELREQIIYNEERIRELEADNADIRERHSLAFDALWNWVQELEGVVEGLRDGDGKGDVSGEDSSRVRSRTPRYTAGNGPFQGRDAGMGQGSSPTHPFIHSMSDAFARIDALSRQNVANSKASKSNSKGKGKEAA